MSETAASIITTSQLSKSFSINGVQQHVLKNIDLEILEGEFTVIMGPSGAGKSTLMYALSGMDQPTLGRIEFDGETISKYSPDKLAKFRRKHCGFVFQQIYLLDHLSIDDNAMAVGLLVNKSRAKVAAEADRLFDLVGIDKLTQAKYPGMLSGGEGQRAAMVRALITSPKVLFADEPTGQLNSVAGTLVLDLLSSIAAKGQTIVMVTHDIRAAARGHRVMYLRDGAIQGEHRPDQTTSIEQRQDQLAGFLAGMGW